MSSLTVPSTGRVNVTSQPRRLIVGLRAFSPVEGALGVAGLVVLLSYVVLAAAHRGDRYQINLPSGCCIALAQRLNDGVFYPALFDGEFYGGTRYMPLSFVLHAGVARLTGEYLVSGKLLAFALALFLFVELFVLLREMGCGRGAAVALTSLVLLTPAGFLACTTIRGDLLPVVLQIAALLVIRRSSTARGAAVAAGLCVLALLTKVTAVWAGLAIACSFLPESRRRTGIVFLTVWLGSSAAGVLLCNAASSGRMFASFAALAAPGSDAHSLFRAPFIVLAQVANAGLAVGMLVPVVVAACVLNARQRCLTIYHSALLFCVPILVAICTDPGVDYNHLLDFVVLGVLIAGHLWSSLPTGEESLSGPRTVFVIALSWVLFAAWLGSMEPRLREVGYRVSGENTRYPAVPLAGHVNGEETILTENPWIDVSRGRTPVVLDAFAFARMTQANPTLAEPLLGKIRVGAFDKIILRHRLDDPTNDRERWESQLFGRPLLRTVADRYRLLNEAEGFFIYVPKQ